MLFSPSGTAIDTVNFPSLSSDMAYARQDATTWSINPKATPGLLNTEENYQALHETVTGAGVEITDLYDEGVHSFDLWDRYVEPFFDWLGLEKGGN